MASAGTNYPMQVGALCITCIWGVSKHASGPKYIERCHWVHSVAHHRGREFMAALGSNKSLLEVDLTSNLIGKQETVKVVIDHLVGKFWTKPNYSALFPMHDFSVGEFWSIFDHAIKKNLLIARRRLSSGGLWHFSSRKRSILYDSKQRTFVARCGSRVFLAQAWRVSLSTTERAGKHIFQVTGAESVGIMLKTNNTLTSLNLGWNSLRMDSAVHVALSLRHNSSLQTLGLAYNSFSDHASQVPGTRKRNVGVCRDRGKEAFLDLQRPRVLWCGSRTSSTFFGRRKTLSCPIVTLVQPLPSSPSLSDAGNESFREPYAYLSRPVVQLDHPLGGYGLRLRPEGESVHCVAPSKGGGNITVLCSPKYSTTSGAVFLLVCAVTVIMDMKQNKVVLVNFLCAVLCM